MLLYREPDITLIANSRFVNEISVLHELYPQAHYFICDNVHAKMVLAEPETVWLSSANFGNSHWFEHTIGIHSKEVFEFYKKELEDYLDVPLK